MTCVIMMGRPGKPHKKAWRKAKKLRQKRCLYCREPFSKKNAPTFDHTLIACLTCNNLRGNADHDAYMRAVQEEHAAARDERRPYRRPRLVGSGILTTATRRERDSAKSRIGES